jgi:hypothetical protein
MEDAVNKQVVYIVGLVASVLTAIAGLVDTFPPEWKPYVVAASVVSGTVFAYLKNPPEATK